MENFNFNLNSLGNSKLPVHIYNPIVQSSTSIVLFRVPEPYVKNKFLEAEKRYIVDQLAGDEVKPLLQVLDHLEVVDIDYQEVSDINLKHRPAQHCRFFRDGVLVHSDKKIKNYFQIGLESLVDVEFEKNDANYYLKLFDFEDQGHYIEIQHLEKLNEIKDRLNVYVYLPKMAKNKVLKLVFEKNKHVKSVYDYFKNNQEKIESDFSNKVNGSINKHFPKEFKEDFLYPGLGISDYLYRIKDLDKDKDEKTNFQKILNSNNPIHRHITPKNALLFSYVDSVSSLLAILVTGTHQFLEMLQTKKINEKQSEFFKKYIHQFEGIHYNDIENISKKSIELIFREEYISFENVRKILTNHPEFVLTKSTLNQGKLIIIFLTIYALVHFTKKGTSIPFVGDIDVQKIDIVSCFCYWNAMSGYLLMSGRLEADNGPAIHYMAEDIEEEKRNPIDLTLKLMRFHTDRNEGYKEIYKIKEPVHQDIKRIAEEIENTGTGEWIPYNAAFEFKDDPEHKYVRFIENKENILFFITNKKEEVLVDLYDKKEKDFKYWIYQNLRGYENAEQIYYKIISAIRDWKVLIDRDSTMTYRGRRVPTGVDTQKTRYIYLPRVRYQRNPGNNEKIREFYNENRKFSGERRAHVRRLPHGAKPSKLQLLLAHKNNIPVPDNHTFVKEALWGAKSMTQKEIRYRTKSLHGLLFVDPQDMQRAEKIDDMSPAAFEENMSKFMAKRGWEIVDRNNYDGGIDIRGFKEFKDGTLKKLIVQCKHWKKAIGPDVIRELIGAKEIEDDGYEKVMMVITSSRFTPGAVEIAEKHNVQLIDGDTLLNEME